MSPLCESYLPEVSLDDAEVFYPLHVRLCERCLLVQLPAYVSGEEHLLRLRLLLVVLRLVGRARKRYADAMIARLSLTPDSLVTEVASNDGYLLQHFSAAGVPVLGVEPAATWRRRPAPRASGRRWRSSAPKPVAIAAGTAGRIWWPANNVFAHVADIRGFAAGLRALVKDYGLVTLEFPHLLRLIESRQYDTIYHEHYSYLSLLTSRPLRCDAGLHVVDVEELTTHGGSLRVTHDQRDRRRANGE